MAGLISKSERDDFEGALRDGGFSLADFAIVEKDTREKWTGVYPINVTIRRKSNAKEKVYKAGRMSKWPAEFTRDLYQGYFGRSG